MVDQPLAEAAEEEFAEAAEPPATDDQEVACHLPDVGQQVVGFKDLAASSATLRGTAGPNRPSTGSPEAIAVTLVIVPPETFTEFPARGSVLLLLSLGVMDSSASLALLWADPVADATGEGGGCSAAGVRSQATAAARLRTATTAAMAERTGRSLITRS